MVRVGLTGGIASGKSQVARIFKKLGAYVIDAETRQGLTALMVAAQAGHLDSLGTLIAAGADINGTDQHDQTALIHAAEGGHPDTVAELIRRGADVNARSARGGTALAVAVSQNHTAVVELLRQSGVKE